MTIVKYEKFLFIEDGSVDIDELEDLNFKNPEIKIIIYRQGSARPEIVDISSYKESSM